MQTQLAELFRLILKLDDNATVAGLSQDNCEAWDSLAHVELVAATEGLLGIVIDLGCAIELRTFADFADLIQRKPEAA